MVDSNTHYDRRVPAKRRGTCAVDRGFTTAVTAVDLFAGAGGASQGLRDAGFMVLAAVENNRDAANTYAANHRETCVVRSDIRSVDAATLRRELGIAPGDLTVLNACPPCQGFSTLGSRDVDDPRNDLIASVWPFVSDFQPEAVVLENVPGIRRDGRLDRLLRQMRAVGYSARGYTIEAADFGVPQRRRRHLVVALRHRRDELPVDVSQFVEGFVPSNQPAVRSVFELTARIAPGSDPHHVARKLRRTTRERVSAIPVDGSRFDLPNDKQLACHKKLKQRHATGPYGRMRANEPAPTLTTRCTTVSCGSFIHPTEDRGISLREAALIQTFPQSYQFCGGYDSIERQIGNALPPRVAELVARAILRLL
jgi:DNA (cytosine-5)-methyltransferase 1